MKQIALNYDASEFDGYESAAEYFAHRSKILKDETGRPVKQAYQAMELDHSPTNWSQKINKLDDKSVSLDMAVTHAKKFKEYGWVYYVIDTVILAQDESVQELEKLQAAIDAKIARLKGKKR
jgi:hypothetical protein